MNNTIGKNGGKKTNGHRSVDYTDDYGFHDSNLYVSFNHNCTSTVHDNAGYHSVSSYHNSTDNYFNCFVHRNCRFSISSSVFYYLDFYDSEVVEVA